MTGIVQGVITRGVKDVRIDERGHLRFLMTDGEELDLGPLGPRGTGIRHVEVEKSGELTFHYDDGRIEIVGEDVYAAMHALRSEAAADAEDAAKSAADALAAKQALSAAVAASNPDALVLDSTLSIPGAAAEAAAVGAAGKRIDQNAAAIRAAGEKMDQNAAAIRTAGKKIDANVSAIGQIRSDLGNKTKLNTADHTNIVSAINEVNNRFLSPVSDAVEAWLDSHPEATTTVQDGSISEAKFSNDLKLRAINHVVTPEMFGAVGDGKTDDTQAFADALASGFPVHGTKGHSYYVHDLEIQNAEISHCVFNGHGEDCFLMRSGCLLENCDFWTCQHAIKIVKTCVASTIRNCLFSYCKNGIYYKGTDSSVNQLRVINSYFVKNGENADDISADPTAGVGYGIYLDANWCGVVLIGNVFEYNTYSGIYMRSTQNYRVAATVIGNYFEGNKNSAIALNVTDSHRDNMLCITGNHFAIYNGGNVKVTTGINVVGNLGYTGIVEDMFGKYTIRSWELKKLNQGRTFQLDKEVTDKSQYFTMYPSINSREGIVYLRYKAVLNTDYISFTVGSESVTFKNGQGKALVPSGSSWYCHRALQEGESIEFIRYEDY